jgi:hypothetical protein
MKKKITILISIILLSLGPELNLQAVTGTRGDPPSEPSGGTPIGGSAPIGNGSIILLGLLGVYGGVKLYHIQNKSNSILKDSVN